MPTITPTVNANALWTGTIPTTIDSAITHYSLYAASADQPDAYRFVDKKPNPQTGAVLTFGPYSYGRLGLVTPTRPFFLKATLTRSGKETEKVKEPTLSQNPSAIPGWTLQQLLEQDMRPVAVVGLDASTGMFYPLNVISDAGNGFKLKI